ncbi:unnamed protein product [Leptosia nina]|uniref:chitinase n=1 Tax=Leptosia nina TaxID=320188 RepID=A0AAV1JEH3_9NEOP
MLISKLLVSFIFVSVVATEKKIICYYGTWATYRNGLGKFDVAHIKAELCTHLVYTFAGINSQGTVVSLDPYLDLPDNWGRNNFRNFNALKQKNTKLKTILAVGGWNEGSAKYSIMAANENLRSNFISSAVHMLLTYGFDGLDLDWEYPNRRDSVHGKADVDNFTKLLKELRTGFDKYGLLLSAAVASTRDTASLSYDIPALAQYLDIVGLMTYDMYGPWDSVTGHNSPLHKGEGDGNVPKESLNTVDVAVQYWLSQGFPAEKLVIGLPFYGHTYNLANQNKSSVRSPSYGPGIAGPYTVTNGNIGYNEFCDLLLTQTWDLRFDNLAKVPYAVQNRNWVSYDDAASLSAKTKYALNLNLAGVMVWSIETDDFHGLCHGEDFPLLRGINRAFSNGSTPSTTPSSGSNTTTTTTSTQSSTTTVPTTTPSKFTCPALGWFPDPDSCRSYYVCTLNEDGSFRPNYFLCPSKLYWDQSKMVCNYPSLVNCDL